MKIELETLIKIEKSQSKLTNYIVKIGKWILFVFPILLTLITVLTLFVFQEIPEASRFVEQPIPYQVLTIIYLILLGVYFLNSATLILGARKTEKSLDMRLKYEKQRGRPIESLDGFDLLTDNVNRVLKLLTVTSLVCIASVVLFVIMLLFGDLGTGYAAMGMSLVGFGLALLIRSLKLDIHSVNGLQDFYKPTTHQIFLDNYFSEVFANHLDPITYLKWDEYILGIEKLLTDEFKSDIKRQEIKEDPITYGIERILFLYYLKYQNVITHERMQRELSEVMNLDPKSFGIEKGLLLENKWYFSQEDIYDLFEYIKNFNPGFFHLIDRIQIELVDNIERLSQDPIYMDSSAQEVVHIGSELNLMVFLFNNSEESKNYRIRVFAPGCDPKELVLSVKVEGRGSFKIPNESIPICSDDATDVTKVMTSMLENGDTTWITLEPRAKGTQTIQIFLEDENGVIIEGETKTVEVIRNLRDYLKKLSSIGSVLGGIGVGVSRILPVLLS